MPKIFFYKIHNFTSYITFIDCDKVSEHSEFLEAEIIYDGNEIKKTDLNFIWTHEKWWWYPDQ